MAEEVNLRPNGKLFKEKSALPRSDSNRDIIQSAYMLQVGYEFRVKYGEDVGYKSFKYVRARVKEDVKLILIRDTREISIEEVGARVGE